MCGKRDFGTDWIHIDGIDFPHTDSSDIMLMGQPPHSVDLIYCSHGIAYFDREEIIKLLKAWQRVLKPGGILRLSTPDWDVLRTFERPLVGPLYGKMNNPPIYHKTVWNERELRPVLTECGFTDIRLYDVTKTEHAHIDDHSHAIYQGRYISLNIECNA